MRVEGFLGRGRLGLDGLVDLREALLDSSQPETHSWQKGVEFHSKVDGFEKVYSFTRKLTGPASLGSETARRPVSLKN